MRFRKEYLEERLKDKAFKEAYDYWSPDFEIADAILEFRAKNNLTQEEMAKRVGMNRSRFSGIETASGNPTLKTLKKIAYALGTRLEIRFQKEEED